MPQRKSSFPRIRLQFGYGIVHFFTTSSVRRYSIFITAISFGKAALRSVTLRSAELKLSIALVVYIVPDPDGRRVLLSPLLIQYGKRILSFAYTDSTIYSSEVGAELFPVLRRYVLRTVPDQMHHTTTDNSCRERIRYCLFKT